MPGTSPGAPWDPRYLLGTVLGPLGTLLIPLGMLLGHQGAPLGSPGDVIETPRVPPDIPMDHKNSSTSSNIPRLGLSIAVFDSARWDPSP